MFEESESFHSRVLRPEDEEKVSAFLKDAPLYPTFLMHNPARDYAQFPGWWQGAFNQNRDIRALACVEGTAGNIYGSSTKATVELARDMARNARQLGKTGARNAAHQLLGEEGVMDDFWSIFQSVGKTVIHDKKRDLVAAASINAVERPGFECRFAQPDDFKVVYEYAADSTLQQWGLDPRRAGKTAHENACAVRIQSGNLLVARDKGKPVFIADLSPQVGDVMMLSNIYVPRPFARRKIIAAALTAAHREALGRGAKSLAFFAEQEDEKLQKAVALCGFEKQCSYRHFVMRG